jgi:hypothetical protein
MATAKTATFEELTKLATDFVTKQKGMWDHTAWMDLVSRLQGQGFDTSSVDMQANLGELLEAMKRFYSAAASTESMDTAMTSIVDESVAFIKRQKGVWGHDEWEDFLKTAQRNTRSLSEGTATYLGGVLESMKVLYSLTPVPAIKQAAPAAPIKAAASKKPAPVSEKKAEPASGKKAEPAGVKKAEPKTAPAKAKAQPANKKPEKNDDLTAIGGIGPAIAKKLNQSLF